MELRSNSVLFGMAIIFVFSITGSCASKKSGDAPKSKEYIPGISNQQVERALDVSRNSIITARVVSKQTQSLIQMQTGRILTSRILVSRAPQLLKVATKQYHDYPYDNNDDQYYDYPYDNNNGDSIPSGEICICSLQNQNGDQLCTYSKCDNGRCEIYSQYRGYVEKYQRDYVGSASYYSVTSYIGVCEDIPSEICPIEVALSYDWGKCDFKLSGYTKIYGGDLYFCNIEYGVPATVALGIEIEGSVSIDSISPNVYLIIHPDKVSKFACSENFSGDFYDISCDIYLAKCSLEKPCSEEAYNKLKSSCSYTKVGACRGENCTEEFMNMIGDLFVEKISTESYCSFGDDERFTSIEKEGDKYIYTSSTSSEVKVLTCSSRSKVDFNSCSMEACDKIEEDNYKLINYNESATAISYDVVSDEANLRIFIDKLGGKVRFSGKVKVVKDSANALDVNIEGVVSLFGDAEINFSSKEFSGNINISARGEISGSIIVQGNTLSLSTTSDGKLKICDKSGNCYVEELL